MSTDRPGPDGRALGRPSGLGDLLACEWTKFRSVRSTYWTLAVAVVTPIGFSVLLAFGLRGPEPGSGPPVDPLLPGLLSLEYAVIAVAVLGVLSFSSEFGTGLIRTTFAAAPRRRAVLAAKAAVTGAVTLVAGELVAFVSFFAVQAILASTTSASPLSRPGVPGAVLATGLLLCVCALIGVAFGAIIRHTAGGIAAAIGRDRSLPAILALLPPPWSDRIGRFTLLDAARQLTALHPQTDLFAPALSLLVLLAWPAVALAAASLLITRHDV